MRPSQLGIKKDWPPKDIIEYEKELCAHDKGVLGCKEVLNYAKSHPIKLNVYCSSANLDLLQGYSIYLSSIVKHIYFSQSKAFPFDPVTHFLVSTPEIQKY